MIQARLGMGGQGGRDQLDRGGGQQGGGGGVPQQQGRQGEGGGGLEQARDGKIGGDDPGYRQVQRAGQDGELKADVDRLGGKQAEYRDGGDAGGAAGDVGPERGLIRPDQQDQEQRAAQGEGLAGNDQAVQQDAQVAK